MKNIIGILLTCIILNSSALQVIIPGQAQQIRIGDKYKLVLNGVPDHRYININSTTNSLTLTAHQTVKRLVINSGVLDLGGDTLTVSTSSGLNGGTINNGFLCNCTA
ncbi:MAG: hypothetical protein IPO63_00905 [Bacteroidetes bacterium]|nr:hypothetical protein [Bacteroidota bacterium]